MEVYLKRRALVNYVSNALRGIRYAYKKMANLLQGISKLYVTFRIVFVVRSRVQ